LRFPFSLRAYLLEDDDLVAPDCQVAAEKCRVVLVVGAQSVGNASGLLSDSQTVATSSGDDPDDGEDQPSIGSGTFASSLAAVGAAFF